MWAHLDQSEARETDPVRQVQAVRLGKTAFKQEDKMKHIKPLFLCAFLGLSACSMATYDLMSFADPTTMAPEYKTFAFLPSGDSNEILEKQLWAWINQDLKSMGYKMVGENPDLIIFSSLSHEKNTQFTPPWTMYLPMFTPGASSRTFGTFGTTNFNFVTHNNPTIEQTPVGVPGSYKTTYEHTLHVHAVDFRRSVKNKRLETVWTSIVTANSKHRDVRFVLPNLVDKCFSSFLSDNKGADSGQFEEGSTPAWAKETN